LQQTAVKPAPWIALAARPSILFGDEEVDDRTAGKAEKDPYIPGLKTPRLYG
jgi:hypothetical protein